MQQYFPFVQFAKSIYFPCFKADNRHSPLYVYYREPSVSYRSFIHCKNISGWLNDFLKK